MTSLFETLLLAVYFIPAGILMLYGLNLYFILFLFLLRKKAAHREVAAIMDLFASGSQSFKLPHVTTQLPLYNEYNVAERAMRAIAAMDYPREKHTIQVLDDSTDETCERVDHVARDLIARGFDVQVVRRTDRTGFKAGALAAGMKKTRADYFAIFDADFVPPKDFLMRTLPVLLVRQDVGLVQARWGHINATSSIITQAQSIGIDGHFAIEQPARAWNKLFMNFNGTAGVWRRQAIDDAGGWEADTLTEDMDLSYRSQLAGWQPFYLHDLVVPAEIPECMNAFKSQQFRWAKGSTQTAIKMLPRVFRSDAPVMAKLQSLFHMTHYAIHPLMVWLAVMALPVIKFTVFTNSFAVFVTFLLMLLVATCAPPTLYAVSQWSLYGQRRRLALLPFLTFIGIGIALSNTRAVLEALFGVASPFVRTPKRGDRVLRSYAVRIPYVILLELMLGIYCFYSLTFYVEAKKYLIGPFLFLYAFGFTFVGALSLVHSWPELRFPFIRKAA